MGIAADDPLVREFEQEARAFYAQQQAAIRRRVTSLIEQVALLEASVRGDYVRAERALTLATKLDPENTMYQAELEAVQRLRALHRQEQGRP
ncbi:MAG: hypothetical protein Q7S95_03575 [bacterium]|nr:hypothetical protein [bacterium]